MDETRDQEAYWNELIDEKAAAEFRNQSVRTLQDYRTKGGGPRYYRLSARCIRYRRIDLKEDAEAMRLELGKMPPDRVAARFGELIYQMLQAHRLIGLRLGKQPITVTGQAIEFRLVLGRLTQSAALLIQRDNFWKFEQVMP